MDRTAQWERISSALIALMILLILFMQMRSLYEFPQPDSSRWWGDETGQMLELRTELLDGYARIPTALGSSVAITNGIVRGNSWMAAAIYGVPALIFSSASNLVEIGRSVTFLLSLLLLFVMYRMLIAFDVSRLLSLAAILLLISTRSFFYASHVARLDVAASVAVVGFVWYCANRFDRKQRGEWEPSRFWYFLFGAAVILFATLSIHLLTLLPALTLYILWRFQAYRKPISLLACAGGAVTALGILLGIYALSGAPFSLFSPSHGTNQFNSVASELPVLRPFSRSVQLANILERVHGLWSEAPAIVLFIALAIVVIFLRRRVSRSNAYVFILGSAFVVLISWLLFQSPALYYYIHVLPLFIIAMTIALSKRWKGTLPMVSVITIVSIALCIAGVRDSVLATETADRIAAENSSAIETADSAMKTDDHSGTPFVLAQNPAIAMLEHDPRVRLMTAHIVSFPTSNESLAHSLHGLNVQYLLLYAAHDGYVYSDDYHALRPLADSLGTVILKRSGILFDVHRDYFVPQTFSGIPDTLILYKLPFAAR